MRVMLLAPGDDIHSQRFLKWLEKAGCEVVFVDDVKPPNLDPSKTSFLSYPNGLPQLARRPGLIRRLRYLQLHFMWRWVRPDIVHLHLVDERAHDCYRARLRPLVLTCWGTDINQHFEPGANSAYAEQTGRALAWAGHVFADSREVLERCNMLARRSLRSTLVYLGIDMTHFHPGYLEAAQAWRQALVIPPNAKILLSVRGWKRYHRHDLILEAFAQARKSLPFPTFLVFKRYGAQDSAYECEVRAMAERLGVTQYLRWIDEVPYERVPELYAMADVIVNFPAVDGFPVSFIEAAALGKRVISSRLSAYSGTVVDEIFRMVSPESVQELVQAMVEVLQEPSETFAVKSEQARRWAQKFGDESACWEAVLTIYRRLVKRGCRLHSRARQNR